MRRQGAYVRRSGGGLCRFSGMIARSSRTALRGLDGWLYWRHIQPRTHLTRSGSPAAGVRLAKRGRAMTDLKGELIRLIEQNHRQAGSVETAITRRNMVGLSSQTETING